MKLMKFAAYSCLMIVMVVLFGVTVSAKPSTQDGWVDGPLYTYEVPEPGESLTCNNEQRISGVGVDDDFRPTTIREFGCVLHGDTFDFVKGHYRVMSDYDNLRNGIYGIINHADNDGTLYRRLKDQPNSMYYYTEDSNALIEREALDDGTYMLHVYNNLQHSIHPTAIYDDKNLEYGIDRSKDDGHRYILHEEAHSPHIVGGRYVFTWSQSDEGIVMIKIDTKTGTIDRYNMIGEFADVGDATSDGRFVFIGSSIYDTATCLRT